MLPTFVITLREGLEASLIVGIVAAFLVKEGRRDQLSRMWLGVGAAVTLCLVVAVALRLTEHALPQQEQEGLEAVIAVVAVGMVSYMIVWMSRHARDLKGALTGQASRALAAGSATAFVVMAFLAVMREGLETTVFLLAVFNDADDTVSAGGGAILGLLVALVIGYGIYRGGVRIDLRRFFKLTGVVLVLVAAGLASFAVHAAHEAGWWNALQAKPLDLSGLVQPGTVSASLLTGMFGLQPKPTTGEILAWLLVAIPLMAYVLMPERLRAATRSAHARQMAGVATTLMALVVLVGCGGSSGGSAAADGAKVVAIALNDTGCTPQDLELEAGATSFEVKGGGSGKVTEFEVFDGPRILGEVENVAPGLKRSFALTLKAGDYVLSCTGGSQEPTGKLTVTGGDEPVTASSEGDAAVKAYRGYLQRQTADLTRRTASFVAAVKAGDVARAKALYVPARRPYERIEPVAESFGNLDPVIDARAGDVPAKGWGGFHKIEQALWVRSTTKGMRPVADKLQADVEKLERLVKTVEIEPANVANGAVALLGEVSKSKITGEEERYSRTDLDDFEANVQGARAAYEIVAPILRQTQPDLARTVAAEFAKVDAALAPYKQGDRFTRYDDLTQADTRKLSQAIDALAEPLSRVPAKVVA